MTAVGQEASYLNAEPLNLARDREPEAHRSDYFTRRPREWLRLSFWLRGVVRVGSPREDSRLEPELRERRIHPLRDCGVAGVVGVQAVARDPLRVELDPV